MKEVTEMKSITKIVSKMMALAIVFIFSCFDLPL